MNLNPKAEKTLHEWHRMVAAKDLSRVEGLCTPAAVFRSPFAFKPYRGAKTVAAFLQQAFQALEDLRYHRTFVSGDSDVVLEFSAVIAGKELKGVDMIHFGSGGTIEEFEVMVRPETGLQALGAEMNRRMTPLLAAAKPRDDN